MKPALGTESQSSPTSSEGFEKEEAQFLQLLQTSHFKYRTLDEAKLLANHLSRACSHPSAAAIGLTEIFVNAVEHGNLGITYEDKSQFKDQTEWLAEIERRLGHEDYRDKVVDVQVDRLPEHLLVKVTDQGKGFDWKKYEGLNENKKLESHGRGIFMAKTLCFEKLIYSDKGNIVLGVMKLKP